MESLPRFSAQASIAALRSKLEAVCRGIAAAVNQAPVGNLINAREAQVRDLFADSRGLA